MRQFTDEIDTKTSNVVDLAAELFQAAQSFRVEIDEE